MSFPVLASTGWDRTDVCCWDRTDVCCSDRTDDCCWDICPVSTADICPVSTCTSKDRKAHWRSPVSFSMQDGTKREAASWKLSAAFCWWLLVILNVFVCNMLLQNACKITKHMSEKLTKLVQQLFQNLSKIDPGGCLEATWEPPLKQDASKT